MHDIFSKNGIGFKKTNTYIGVRVETNHNNLKRLFDYSFDPKIWAFYGKRKVKTHCFCRHGNIISTYYLGIPVIGGYTQFTSKNGIPEKEQSPNSNFNILISTDRSKDEIMKILKQFKAINPDGGVFQKLSDFMATTDYEISQSGCSFNQCNHGNIRLILDRLDSSGSIIADFLLRLSKIVPGILEGDSIVYAPAVEWFMDSVEVDSHMETTQTNWFAVGDGAGLSQGIVHAAATSIIAAEEICKRLEAKTF